MQTVQKEQIFVCRSILYRYCKSLQKSWTRKEYARMLVWAREVTLEISYHALKKEGKEFPLKQLRQDLMNN